METEIIKAPNLEEGVKVFDFSGAAAGYLTELEFDDYVYTLELNGEKLNLSGTNDKASGRLLIDVEDLGDDHKAEIIRTARALGACLKGRNLGSNLHGLLKLPERKGVLAQQLIQQGRFDLCMEHVRGDIDAAELLRRTGNSDSSTEVDVLGRIPDLDGFEAVRDYAQHLLAHLRTRVKGQDAVLQQLIFSFVAYLIDPRNQHQPTMLVGPSGSGKTYSIRTLCSHVGIPFHEITTPTLSPATYKGTTIQAVFFDALTKVIEELGGYPNRMVIYLDEFGKLVFRGNKDDGFSEQLQSEILKLFEPGGVVTRGDGYDRINRLKLRAMLILSDALSFMEYEGLVTRAMLVKHGMMEELAGRIKLLTPFSELDSEQLYDILVNGEDTALKTRMALATTLGIDLEIDDSALVALAEHAHKDGFGGRSLNTAVEAVFDRCLEGRVFGSGGPTLKLNRAIVTKHLPKISRRKRRAGY